MLYFEEIVRRTLEQKRKYHSKVLTDNALLITFDRAFDTFDLFAIEVWILSDLFTNIAISFSLLFDVDPIDFEQLNQLFEPELPTPEEDLQGILIKMKRIKLPDVGTTEDLIRDNVKEEVQKQVEETRPRKARYGITKYGESYYDPVNVRLFIANTVPRFFHNLKVRGDFKNFTDSYRDALGVLDTISKYIFNRLHMLFEAQRQNFILGYGVLGYSRLTPRASDTARLEVLDYDGRLLEVKYKFLDHVHNAFILGLTPLGFGFLGGKETIYKEPSPRCVKWVNDIAWNTIPRYYHTPWAVGNYNKLEERADFRVSERADQYMALQLLRYKLEDIVSNILEGEDLTVTELRQYKNAVTQLIALRTKRHKWGYKPFKQFNDEELKKWWIEYWVRQGLNKSLLEKIWGAIGKWLKSWEHQKVHLGKLVAERRRYLALWLSTSS